MDETMLAERKGAWVKPVNRWQGAENSIHTDSVAQSLGMRGGTIPGTVHLNSLRPVLDDLFGDRWLIDGVISMFYTYATTDGEDVRAVIKSPPGRCWDKDALFNAWVENADGKIVIKGTVSVGAPQQQSYVRALALENSKPETRRITKDLVIGKDYEPEECVFKNGEDGIIRDPQTMYGALASGRWRPLIARPSVGLFGSTEVALRNGPIHTDTPYRRTGRVVCIGMTDKTEFAWMDSELTDANGKLIAEMRHLTRWMKASSPLWKS